METATQTLHRLTSHSWGWYEPSREDDDLWSAIRTVTPGVAGQAEPEPPKADPKADVR
ncbi:MAG: hypothetical protein WB297_02040 [Actinomycetota bacterium]